MMPIFRFHVNNITLLTKFIKFGYVYSLENILASTLFPAGLFPTLLGTLLKCKDTLVTKS